MGALLGFRRKRSSFPEFEETLARLQDELTLSESFANSMVRSGQYKAAIGILDEQRERLQTAEAAMANAFRPRQRRVQVAIGGLAAVMLLGSASFAALSLRSPDAQSAPLLIQSAQRNLEQASQAATDHQAQAFVAEALSDLASIDGDTPGISPGMRDEVSGLLEQWSGEILRGRPNMRNLVAQIKDLAQKVKAEVDEPDEPSPIPSPSGPPDSPPSTQSTPSASAPPTP